LRFIEVLKKLRRFIEVLKKLRRFIEVLKKLRRFIEVLKKLTHNIFQTTSISYQQITPKMDSLVEHVFTQVHYLRKATGALEMLHYYTMKAIASKDSPKMVREHLNRAGEWRERWIKALKKAKSFDAA
jgi:hypothetical protein